MEEQAGQCEGPGAPSMGGSAAIAASEGKASLRVQLGGEGEEEGGPDASSATQQSEDAEQDAEVRSLPRTTPAVV